MPLQWLKWRLELDKFISQDCIEAAGLTEEEYDC
jgi:hypothetical protein